MGRDSKKKKLKHKSSTRKRSKSSSSSSSSQEYRKRKKQKKDEQKQKKSDKNGPASPSGLHISSSSSEEDTGSIITPEQMCYKTIRKELKEKYREQDRIMKNKLEEEKSKRKKHKHRKTDKDREEIKESSDVPITLMEKAKAMAPMTKEQWEKKQNVIKKVYDEETGRERLIRGDGEIIEQIVSREQHKAINRQATLGDGCYFQSKIGSVSKK